MKFKNYFTSNFSIFFHKIIKSIFLIWFQPIILWNSKKLLFYKISSSISQSPQKNEQMEEFKKQLEEKEEEYERQLEEKDQEIERLKDIIKRLQNQS